MGSETLLQLFFNAFYLPFIEILENLDKLCVVFTVTWQLIRVNKHPSST